MHGKPSQMSVTHAGRIFHDMPERITVGRYHSLYADRAHLPDDLMITAQTDDGVIMGLEHRHLPVAAVQFHPESIMSLGQDAGIRMIENAIMRLTVKT